VRGGTRQRWVGTLVWPKNEDYAGKKGAGSHGGGGGDVKRGFKDGKDGEFCAVVYRKRQSKSRHNINQVGEKKRRGVWKILKKKKKKRGYCRDQLLLVTQGRFGQKDEVTFCGKSFWGATRGSGEIFGVMKSDERDKNRPAERKGELPIGFAPGRVEDDDSRRGVKKKTKNGLEKSVGGRWDWKIIKKKKLMRDATFSKQGGGGAQTPMLDGKKYY